MAARQRVPIWSRGGTKSKARKVMKRKSISSLRSRSQTRPRADGKLRAISLTCPELAVAILAKQKTVENRSWRVPACRRSPEGTWLALHVSAGSGRPYIPPALRKHIQKAWDPEKAYWPWNKMDIFSKKTGAPLPRAAIVGLIRVKGDHKLKRGEKAENPWALGPICWEIDRAVPLDPPIENVNGKLSLWSVDQAVSLHHRRRLYAALREAKMRPQRGCYKPRP
eukprot:TRINITY_DN36069_c0_g1_i1.p1 TRINITY_DN36069_c0_g1~~TRINITY_DN36069_c0_g1_i1.p1  ORF type:complete len:242 (+),score=32.24 TRINITY_DN36069_c0_g1_i1:57-728(+)